LAPQSSKMWYKGNAMLTVIENPIEGYLEYSKTLRVLQPTTIKRYALHLTRIQAELGFPILEVTRGSQIEQAIIQAATKRKMKYNGGHVDDGRQFRFRMGIEAANFFSWAHREFLIERNPYPRNTFPKPPKPPVGFLDDDRLSLVLSSPVLRVEEHMLIRFMLDTGLRRFEVCDVKLSDINFETRLVRVKGKCDKWASLPITPTTITWIAFYLSLRKVESEYLVCNLEGGRLNPNMLNKIFHDISAAMNFRVHPHMLRHTLGTMLIMQNEQIVVMQYLRHNRPEMTNHYVHLTGKHLKQIQEKTFSNKPNIFAAQYPSRYQANKN